MEGEEATSRIVVLGLLVDCEGEAGVLSGEAGVEGLFGGEEIGERKVTIGSEGRSDLEGVKDWKYLLGQKALKDSRHKEEKLSVMQLKKEELKQN